MNKVGDSMKDMDMVNGRTFLRNAVLEHFGVPREIMGITESSNRATSEAAQFIYAQNVLMPNLRRREEAINNQIIPYFGNDLVWRFDDIIPRNQEFDKALGIDGWNAGLLTKDEAREKLGMPPALVGGDVYKTQFSDVYIREDDDPVAISTAAANLQYAESAPPLETGGEQDIEITDNGIPLDAENGSEGAGDGTEGIEIVSSKGTSPEERKSLQVQAAQRALLQAEREQTQRFEIATLKYLREQGRRVSDAMGGTTKDERSVWDILMGAIPGYDPNSEDAAEQSAAAWSSLSEADRTRLVSAFTLGLIDWPKEETALLNIFEPLWKATTKALGCLPSSTTSRRSRGRSLSARRSCGAASGSKASQRPPSSPSPVSSPLAWSTETAGPPSPSRLNRRCRPRHPGRVPSLPKSAIPHS